MARGDAVSDLWVKSWVADRIRRSGWRYGFGPVPIALPPPNGPAERHAPHVRWCTSSGVARRKRRA